MRFKIFLGIIATLNITKKNSGYSPEEEQCLMRPSRRAEGERYLMRPVGSNRSTGYRPKGEREAERRALLDEVYL